MISSLGLQRFFLMMLLLIIITGCGVERSTQSEIATITIQLPTLKSNTTLARNIENKGVVIPDEITKVLFRLSSLEGRSLAEIDLLSDNSSKGFQVLAGQSYVLTGIATAGDETLFEGSQTITALHGGEERAIALSLESKLKLVLGTDDNPSNKTSLIQVAVGTNQTTQFNISLEGVSNKSVVWYVNDIPGGNESLGTINTQGEYTPPQVIPSQSLITLTVVPEIAPSFSKSIELELIQESESSGENFIEAPVINVIGGSYSEAQNIELSCNNCQTIYFTTNGDIPTNASTAYETRILVGETLTLQYFSVHADGQYSEIQQQNFVINETTPVTAIQPFGGSFDTPQSIVLSCEDCTTIYYTLDNTTPNVESAVYTSPITIDSNKILQYFSIDQAGNQEPINTAIYVLPTFHATGPNIQTSSPTYGEYYVATYLTNISINFLSALNPVSVNNNTVFFTHENGTNISGNVSYDNTNFRISFAPDESLLSNTDYTLTITTDLLDTNDEHLEQQYQTRFRTRIPNLYFGDERVDENIGNVELHLYLDVPSSRPATLNYYTTNNTAEKDSDYVSTNGTITFSPGETTKNILISIIDDSDAEQSETLYVEYEEVSGVSNSGEAIKSYISITDNDTLLPPNFNVTPGDKQVFLELTEVPIATHYNVYYSNQPGLTPDNYAVLDGKMVTTQINTITILNLVNNSTYYFIVTALSDDIESMASTEITAKPFIASTPPVQPLLNDTGLTFGGDYPSGNNIDCSGDSVLQQDCSSGRDSTHNDNSDGHAGFSYTKLDSSGNELPATAENWNCVKDNVTNLIWEVKQAPDSGELRDALNKYSWFSSDTSNNGGFSGRESSGVCSDIGNCGSERFIARVNVEGICGFKDWRLPNIMELNTLMNWNADEILIDLDYFPFTQNGRYLSSTPWPQQDKSSVWATGFSEGRSFSAYKSNPNRIRLVRKNQTLNR